MLRPLVPSIRNVVKDSRPPEEGAFKKLETTHVYILNCLIYVSAFAIAGVLIAVAWPTATGDAAVLQAVVSENISSTDRSKSLQTQSADETNRETAST